MKEKLTYSMEINHLHVYTEAFIYEPGIPDNICLSTEFYQPEDYVNGVAPSSLSKYNQDFKSIGYTTINTSCRLTKCEAGFENNDHVILDGAPSCLCKMCGRKICKMCADVIMKEINSKVLCLDCYYQQISPSDCYLDTNEVSTSIKTQKQMLKELVDIN